MLCKVICFMFLCTFKAKVTTCKTIVYVIEILSKVVVSTTIAIYKWFNKPRIRHTKRHCKTSNGSGKFPHILCAKKSCYNERNCTSRRRGRRHTFMKHKSQRKRATSDNSNQDLKIKSRKSGTFKSSPSPSLHPQRLNCML